MPSPSGRSRDGARAATIRTGKNTWSSGTSMNIETLDTYKGKIRAIRAVVTKPEEEEDPATWCFALIGQRARQLSRPTALRIIRSRWHIENTAFHQWTRYWNLRHVFRHTQNALLAVLLLWTLAFNLLLLFIYRRLGRCRMPRDT